MTYSQKIEYPTLMTEAERYYLFDLNGFLIIRYVLTPDEIQQANDAITRRQEKIIESNDSVLRNAVPDEFIYFGRTTLQFIWLRIDEIVESFCDLASSLATSTISSLCLFLCMLQLGPYPLAP